MCILFWKYFGNINLNPLFLISHLRILHWARTGQSCGPRVCHHWLRFWLDSQLARAWHGDPYSQRPTHPVRIARPLEIPRRRSEMSRAPSGSCSVRSQEGCRMGTQSNPLPRPLHVAGAVSQCEHWPGRLIQIRLMVVTQNKYNNETIKLSVTFGSMSSEMKCNAPSRSSPSPYIKATFMCRLGAHPAS
jgi:hypothetical protein